jgi:acyl carrier protein
VPAHDRAVDDAERLVLDAIRGLVAKLHPYAPPRVQLDSALDRDLGLDSLALAELLARLGATLGVLCLPTGLLRTAATPRDLARAIGPAAAHPRPAGSRRRSPRSRPRSPQELTTLAASLDWHATTHPDRLHVRILGENADTKHLTYWELRHDARAMAAGRLDLGVSPGESVASPSPCAAPAGSSAPGDASWRSAIDIVVGPPVHRAGTDWHAAVSSAMWPAPPSSATAANPTSHDQPTGHTSRRAGSSTSTWLPRDQRPWPPARGLGLMRWTKEVVAHVAALRSVP